VFVKGIDDTDITYWLKKVQFKLHESIPNPLRSMCNSPSHTIMELTPITAVEAVPGQPFSVSETGWGEFEISIKLHYVSESLEKPQTLWHGLRLHPYGTDEEKENMKHEVQALAYEEQIFNEPYEAFYEILTSGPPPVGKGGKGGAGGGKNKGRLSVLNDRIGERTAMVPARSSPGQPFSRETEQLEIKRLKEARAKVDEMTKELTAELKKKEDTLTALRSG
jgi:YEATS domain-containing protein 4